MRIKAAYDHWSKNYDHDNNKTRDLDQTIVQQVLSDTHFQHALELGCGTGKNTQLLAAISTSVLAMDFSTGMLEKASANIDNSNVLFEQADLNTMWPAKSATYDLVLCSLVLEHIENIDFIFQQVFRCLQPGGVFMLNEYHPCRQYLGGKACFTQKDETVVQIDSFVHHVSSFLNAGKNNQLELLELQEYWHHSEMADDGSHITRKPPRLLSLSFRKPMH